MDFVHDEGLRHLRMRAFSKAENSFKTIIDDRNAEDVNKANAYSGMARVFMNQGHFEKALQMIRHCDQFADREVLDSICHLKIGCYTRLGMFTEAANFLAELRRNRKHLPSDIMVRVTMECYEARTAMNNLEDFLSVENYLEADKACLRLKNIGFIAPDYFFYKFECLCETTGLVHARAFNTQHQLWTKLAGYDFNTMSDLSLMVALCKYHIHCPQSEQQTSKLFKKLEQLAMGVSNKRVVKMRVHISWVLQLQAEIRELEKTLNNSKGSFDTEEQCCIKLISLCALAGNKQKGVDFTCKLGDLYWRNNLFAKARLTVDQAADEGNIEALRIRRNCFWREKLYKKARADAETICNKTSNKEDADWLQLLLRGANENSDATRDSVRNSNTSSRSFNSNQQNGDPAGQAGQAGPSTSKAHSSQQNGGHPGPSGPSSSKPHSNQRSGGFHPSGPSSSRPSQSNQRSGGFFGQSGPSTSKPFTSSQRNGGFAGRAGQAGPSASKPPPRPEPSAPKPAKQTEEGMYLEILGLDSTATLADVKKSFIKASLKYHPDKNPHIKSEEEKRKLNEKMRQITEAKNHLTTKMRKK